MIPWLGIGASRKQQTIVIAILHETNIKDYKLTKYLEYEKGPQLLIHSIRKKKSEV